MRDVLPAHRPATSPVVERLYSARIATGAARPGLKLYHLLYEDHVRIARTLDRADLLDALARRARTFVAEHARRRIFVHAGVVGWRGRAIAIPGRSLSGKSTLVAELVRAGASYLSDEFAVIDERGLVHPFAKPISLRLHGSAEPQVDLDPATLGEVGSGPLPLGLVVVTRFREDARWRPRTLSPGEAILALLSSTLVARRSPERALTLLERASAEARAIRGARGDARDVAPRLLALCERSTPSWRRDHEHLGGRAARPLRT